MNGRIYDPTLGRFLQADPHIQAPTNTQNYNRYSYVLNNPMSYTDPSGYFFKSIRRGLIKGAVKILGAKVVNLVGTTVSSVYGGSLGAAAWTYEFNRAMGNSTTGSLRAAFVAGVNTWANGPQSINASSALQAMDVIDPETAKYLNFAMNGINPDDWGETVRRGLNEYKNHLAQEEVGRLARRNGMTGEELNALLTLGSFAGNKIAGSRYKGSHDGVEMIAGMGRRSGGMLTWEIKGLKGFNFAGLPFDVIDIMLGYQGKFTASAYEYIQHGDKNNRTLGYSLGAMDLNNLASRGYVHKDSHAVSLPFLNFGVTNVTIGTHDPINGGIYGAIFSPHAEWENEGLGCHTSHCYFALGNYGGKL